MAPLSISCCTSTVTPASVTQLVRKSSSSSGHGARRMAVDVARAVVAALARSSWRAASRLRSATSGWRRNSSASSFSRVCTRR